MKACIQCLRKDVDVGKDQRLYNAYDKLLISITRPFGPFISNDQRVLCFRLYKEALQVFHEVLNVANINSQTTTANTEQTPANSNPQTTTTSSNPTSPTRTKTKSRKSTKNTPKYLTLNKTQLTNACKNNVFDMPVFIEFCTLYKQDHPQSPSLDVLDEGNYKWWTNIFLQTLQTRLDALNQEFFDQYHRSPKTKSKLAPNFAYAFEFFDCDWYEYTIPAKLNSMILESSLSVPKAHAQATSNKKLATALLKIADSLYWKERLDQLLVSTVDPTTQNNLFNMLTVRLQRCLLGNLSRQASSLILKFNASVKWVDSNVWDSYRLKYLEQSLKYVRMENKRRKRLNQPNIDITEYYFPPYDCKVGKQSWSKTKITNTHEGIICLLSEYMYTLTPDDATNKMTLFNNTDRYEWIDLLFKALGVDKYKSKLSQNEKTQIQSSHHQLVIDSDEIDPKKEAIENARHQLYLGIISIRSRTLTTITISRRSAADCSLRAEDFIWSWFRLGADVETKIHIAGKIIEIFQIDNLHVLMPFLPIHLFPYNVCILLELWQPCNLADWDEDTWAKNPITNEEPKFKPEFGM